MSEAHPGWRVTFWFLTGDMGWTQLGFAFLSAEDEQHAISKAAQRAVKFGFTVNKDTTIDCRRETDGRL
jgi:hypothetical protein